MQIDIQDFLDFSLLMPDENELYYQFKHVAENLLVKIFPKFFFEKSQKEKQMFFENQTPIVFFSDVKNECLEIIALCKKRSSVIGFFYDMLSRYLLPYKPVKFSNFFSCDLLFREFSDDVFVLLHANIKVSSKDEIDEILKNKKAIDIELRLGLSSDYHANRIMEFKGLSEDKKTVLIQEKIAALIRYRSKDFGKSIFSHMQHFLVTSTDDFKKKRDYHHLSRIISIFYFMRKLIKKKCETVSNKRNLMVKFLKTKLRYEEDEKNVLGILVGLNFLKQHEVFEKQHLIRAIKQYIPNVQAVEDSYFVQRRDKNQIQTLYLEIERKCGMGFSFEEIDVLRNSLPGYLSQHIEHLVYPIFMPHNEEEIMKNILTLARQIRSVYDIPHVIIMFNEQSEKYLSFSVIIVRILRFSSVSIEKMCLENKAAFIFRLDRIKKVGAIRRKCIKEATVFDASVHVKDYIRIDNFVDLKKARQNILSELNRLFGEIRDFNGGMIAKQDEAFLELKKGLGKIDKEQELILEKYFFAIRPVSMALTTNKKILQSFFLMFLNAIKREKTRPVKQKDLLFKQDSKALYIIIPTQKSDLKHHLDETVEKMDLLSSEVFSFVLSFDSTTFLGYVFLSEKNENQKLFLSSIQVALDF